MLRPIQTVDSTDKAKLPKPTAAYGFRWLLDGDRDWALHRAEGKSSTHNALGWLMVVVHANERGELVLHPMFRFNDCTHDTDVHLYDVATDQLGAHICGLVLMRGNKGVSDGKTK